MIKDITLGQYFPGHSPIHRLDPRTKFIGLILYFVVLFMSNGIYSYALSFVFLSAVFLMSGLPIRTLLKSLRPMRIIIILSALMTMFYTEGRILFRVWRISLTFEGILAGAFLAVRMILLVSSASFLTYTTSPMGITDAITSLLKPLTKIKVPVHDFAMVMSITLRFIPTLIEETDKIMSAQKSRGGNFDSGNLIKKARALVPVLVPLFVSAFRRALELSTAMEARLYRGGENRTRLNNLRFGRIDLLGFAALGLLLGGTIAIRMLL